MRIKSLLCSTALIAMCAGTANAQPHGWYLGLEAGWSIVNDVDATFRTTYDSFTTRLQADFDDGWAILATAGYAFTGNWRVEGEVGYRNNDLGQVRFRDPPCYYGYCFSTFSPGGTLEEVSLMVNVLYDIYFNERFKLSLGGGLGADWANLDLDHRFTDNFNTFHNDNGDGSWSFALQAIVGLSYAVTPRTDLFVNYRYMWIDGADIDNVRDFRDFCEYCFDRNNRFSTDDFNKQTVTIGFRYDLYPEVLPPPPPPPPPPVVVEPPKPRQFIVFFGFNKSNITAEADRVISEAAEAARTFGSASISVVGHTDTVGSPEYNQRLSERRAYAVRGSLASKGIPDSAITTSGRGEMDLMVQTGDGVKEPQNRRATIDLTGN